MEKKLKIGIDIDNVVADTGSMFLDRFNKEFGTSITYEEVERFSYFDTHSGIDKSRVEYFTKTVLDQDEFFESLDPYKAAHEAITQWVRDRHSIHYITARPTVNAVITKKWLKTHGFLVHGATLDLHDTAIHKTPAAYKKAVAEKIGLDIMIEDDLEYAASLTVPVLLIDRPWNRTTLPSHVRRVNTWSEIKEIIAGAVRY